MTASSLDMRSPVLDGSNTGTGPSSVPFVSAGSPIPGSVSGSLSGAGSISGSGSGSGSDVRFVTGVRQSPVTRHSGLPNSSSGAGVGAGAGASNVSRTAGGRSNAANTRPGSASEAGSHSQSHSHGTSQQHQQQQHPPATAPGSRINMVTYRNATIKALIDPSLPVVDVIRQLCANAHLGVQEPPALFALRDDENEELIDDNNMARKIEAGKNFKLCSSPTIEAVEMVDKLGSRDERVLKMATYTLQRLIREKPFSVEFLKRGGLVELVGIIRTFNSGNTLAYALTSCQNLMEGSDSGWEDLDGPFIAKVVDILVTQERINVCRPATAILKKLVVSGPNNAPTEQGGVVADGDGAASANGNGSNSVAAETASGPAKRANGELPGVYRFGFEGVYNHIQNQTAFLNTLVQRLSSADTTLCLYSLSLINSLLRNVSDNLFDVFTAELEHLGVSKAVARLMDSNRGEELSTSILEYQNNVIRVAHHRLRTQVTPTDKRHVSALSYIWLQARITDAPAPSSTSRTPPLSPTPSQTNGRSEESSREVDRSSSAAGPGSRLKWRRLGFATESVAKEFGRTGWLGLECLEAFVRTDPEAYAKIILEQINRPEERRCPFGRASIEVTEILTDHWDIESGYTTSTVFLPFLLFFQKVHYLSLLFFLRMWNESGAAASDFSRVSALVRSQVKEALRNESTRTWYEVERDFLDSEYRTVRDRQMKELEIEDDFSSKASIRNLRGRLYRESYEFVRQQRIQCLLEGAWFRNPTTTKFGSAQRRTPAGGQGSKQWRFYRLSPNKKFLHYCEAAERGPIRGGLDDLPEKIDLSLVTDIALQTATMPDALPASASSGMTSFNDTVASQNNGQASQCFSLLSAPDVSLADMAALNQGQYSEWTDGLSMLRGEGGVVSTRETAEVIQILTEIGVKVKLLDLGGERIEIPTSIPPPPVPLSTQFFFADL